jgi:EGF-like domain
MLSARPRAQMHPPAGTYYCMLTAGAQSLTHARQPATLTVAASVCPAGSAAQTQHGCTTCAGDGQSVTAPRSAKPISGGRCSASSECSGHGTCIMHLGPASFCRCKPGWFGADCEVRSALEQCSVGHPRLSVHEHVCGAPSCIAHCPFATVDSHKSCLHTCLHNQ